MEIIDYIVIAVIVLIVGGAAAYIIKAKKSGKKCIGCPDSATCGKQSSYSGCCGDCGSCCGCASQGKGNAEGPDGGKDE